MENYLKDHGINELFVMGVFAEGYVGATALDALRHGYKVNVIADAVATNGSWKKQFVLWSMNRSGATLLTAGARVEPNLELSQSGPDCVKTQNFRKSGGWFDHTRGQNT